MWENYQRGNISRLNLESEHAQSSIHGTWRLGSMPTRSRLKDTNQEMPRKPKSASNKTRVSISDLGSFKTPVW